jgi:hypothetical protein
MSARRDFFKQAGAIAAVPLAGIALMPKAKPAAKAGETIPKATEAGEIVLENAEMRFVIGEDGKARSLIHKATRQECLVQDASARVPMFTVTQLRPYDNELQLAYPAKVTSFPAQAVHLEGDQFFVSFTLVGYEAIIGLKITDSYIGFTLRRLEYKGFTSLTDKRKTPIDQTLFLQLPVRARKNLGDWLTVTWDDEVAVNLLGTDPFAKIDVTPCTGHYLFQAGTVDEIGTEGVGAALITTATKNLLDRVAAVEEDYDLPRGVESRRRTEYRYSYYEMRLATPENIDRHIKFARMGGFRSMDLHYKSFAKTVGHFEWQPEYPNGMQDLKAVVGKIADAGLIPGIHIHYNKCHKEDAYVTPKPDPRLSLSRTFTLAEPLDATSATINVEENPRLCTLEKERRILKIQNELVTYERYTPRPPFQFLDCERGALNTHAESHEEGTGIGLVDVDTLPIYIRFTQNTSIQKEVAERVGKIYHDAGFKFVYFDGAEDTPTPFWYTVSRAQWIVWQELDPKPLFSEGACKSHFSWHILTRGNAFDVFNPEVIKAATRAYPATEAPRVAKDFTSINFGWIGYWAPSKETIGTQPDMLEYITSRAAAWDCPIALVGELEELDAHPRTPDNLEVVKRWEDVRASNWLTEAQKQVLRNVDQEHTLLINESGNFELVACSQIQNVAGADGPARAFIFERAGKVYVAYWHTSGEATLEVPLQAHNMRLMRELGKAIPFRRVENAMRLPLVDRLYVECAGISSQEITRSFQKARILTS